MTGTVLDASAVLAWLFEESGADIVDDALAGSAMSAVNVAEVLYRCQDRGMRTDGLTTDLSDLGVAIEPLSVADAHLVPRVRALALGAGVRCSLADYACLALGLRLNAPILSADRAWPRIPLPVRVEILR